jgi:uncharacterized membrane protein YdbT with pleckstrin-like domain
MQNMKQIDKILNKDEKIIWQGTPQLLPFIFKNISYFFIGLILSIFISLIISSYVIFENGRLRIIEVMDAPFTYVFGFIVFLFTIPAVFYLFEPLYLLLLRKNTLYIFTDKRVLLQSGVIGKDYESFDYDQIRDLEVNITLVDKIFGKNSGSIFIDIGKMTAGRGGRAIPAYLGLEGITNPYAVYEQLKKLSYNLKSDEKFPNEKRLKENSSYQTEIKS